MNPTHIADGSQLLPQVGGFQACCALARVQTAVVNSELGPHEVGPGQEETRTTTKRKSHRVTAAAAALMCLRATEADRTRGRI